MKKKGILMGILGLVLVFGLGMALAGCNIEDTVEIVFTNASQADIDDDIDVRVYVSGRYAYLQNKPCPRGESVTFSLETGDYRVQVYSGWTNMYFPQDGSYVDMSGTVKLRYNGGNITRTN